MNKIKRLWLMVALPIMLVSLGGCTLPETTEGGGGFDWTLIVFLVFIFGLMYFVLIRPQRKKQKEHQQLVEELRRGDKVITAGGIYGVIESTSEDSIVIKVESGVTMRVARSSVSIKQET
ncbi:preprotein translocase subunit YajC [Chloroflexota bacterium]